MNAILGFKNFTDEELEEAPCGEDLRSKMLDFHGFITEKAQIAMKKEEEGGEVKYNFDRSKYSNGLLF